jgi:leucyl/phenylalanyl-tRNA---protein transferase
MTTLPWLDENSIEFPPTDTALTDPPGLLAAGGDLSTPRLIAAYRIGIFPWYEDDQPILWWSPEPRSVLFPDQFKISRSLSKTLKQNKYEVRVDTAFEAVITACSRPRVYAEGTWITDEMIEAYVTLHNDGVAHSIECYLDSKLVGGLYGLAIGKLFFGESMFHYKTDASKVAFAFLCRLMRQHNCPLIDCQIPNDHLTTLGATSISKIEFNEYLQHYVDVPDDPDWSTLPTVFSPW